MLGNSNSNDSKSNFEEQQSAKNDSKKFQKKNFLKSLVDMISHFKV